jgi:hypothetical protein
MAARQRSRTRLPRGALLLPLRLQRREGGRRGRYLRLSSSSRHPLVGRSFREAGAILVN